jgi:hypothetical protein
MIQNVVENIGGVAVFGVISICLFFVVFGGMMFWALRLEKLFLNSMSVLPLDEQESAPARKGEPRHE